MKLKHILNSAIIAVAITSCAGGNTNTNTTENEGVRFNPKEKTSKMSDEERKAAIAERKASLTVDINSMMNSNGVKLTVLPPVPAGDITPEISELIGMKMLTLIAANGIGGVNNVPDFALAATMVETGRQTTSSAPQKYILKYDITFQVMNVLNGTVYSSSSESVTGVGNSFVEAARNAVNEIKPTNSLQATLATGSERIIKWYDDNLPTIKDQVSKAVTERNYALALAYLNSVPSQAAGAYAYAHAEYPKVLEMYMKENAVSELAQLKSAIAMGEQAGELNESVYTHLALIPSGTSEYSQAEKLVENYEKNVLSRQAAAREQEYNTAEAERLHNEKMELARLEADKSIALAEAKASEQAMRLHMREKDDSKRGFWGNLGARIIGGLDYIGDKVSGNSD